MPDNNQPDPQPPKWTTGQGIGFFAALSGLLLIVGAIIVAAMSVFVSAEMSAENADAIQGLYVVMAAIGIMLAAPGIVVFFKCRTRRSR